MTSCKVKYCYKDHVHNHIPKANIPKNRYIVRCNYCYTRFLCDRIINKNPRCYNCWKSYCEEIRWKNRETNWLNYLLQFHKDINLNRYSQPKKYQCLYCDSYYYSSIKINHTMCGECCTDFELEFCCPEYVRSEYLPENQV